MLRRKNNNFLKERIGRLGCVAKPIAFDPVYAVFISCNGRKGRNDVILCLRRNARDWMSIEEGMGTLLYRQKRSVFLII